VCAQPTKSESATVSGAASDRYVERLWVVMSEQYGHKLTSAFGDTPPATWIETLDGLTHVQWLRGIRKLKDTTEAWPPSAPEFKGWCTGEDESWEHRRLAAGPETVLALPEKPQAEVVQNGLAMLRKALD
jgi:hypothetical protein